MVQWSLQQRCKWTSGLCQCDHVCGTIGERMRGEKQENERSNGQVKHGLKPPQGEKDKLGGSREWVTSKMRRRRGLHNVNTLTERSWMATVCGHKNKMWSKSKNWCSNTDKRDVERSLSGEVRGEHIKILRISSTHSWHPQSLVVPEAGEGIAFAFTD